MNRISSLTIAEHCGLAPQLGETHGAGRAALLSSAYHARAAGNPDTRLEGQLTDAERAELETMELPHDQEVGDSPVLRWSEATREAEVTLTLGDHTSIGHVDAYWVIDDTVYVCDIKLSAWTVSGPDTLQLIGYGLALAQQLDLEFFACGIWIAAEGRAVWTGIQNSLWDEGGYVPRVIHAMGNRDDVGQTGSHCDGCYSRLHCPEYLIPAAEDSWLAPFSEHAEITEENALDLLLRVQARLKVDNHLLDQLKVFAKRNNGIVDLGAKKSWRQYSIKGRERLPSVKQLREDRPELADELAYLGPETSGVGWRNS